MDKDNVLPNLNSSVYSIVTKLSKENIFKYAIILFIIYAIISRFKLKTQHVVALQLGYLLVTFLLDKDDTNYEKYVHKINYKLNFLNKILLLKKNTNSNETVIIDNNNIILQNNKSYLIENPLIINLLYNIKDYRYYNSSAYRQILININNILKIVNKNAKNNKYTKSNYDLLLQYKNEALNNLHSIIYNLESNSINNKRFQVSLNDLDNLLNLYINRYYNKINKDFDLKKDINITSNSIDKYEYNKYNKFDYF